MEKHGPGELKDPFISFNVKEVIEWCENSIKENKGDTEFKHGWVMAMETIIRVIKESSWKVKTNEK